MNWQHEVYHQIDYSGLTPWKPIGFLIKGPLYKTQLLLWHAKNRNNQHFYIVAQPTGKLDDQSFMYFLHRDNYEEYCDGAKIPVYNFGHTTLSKFTKSIDKREDNPFFTHGSLHPSDLALHPHRRNEPHSLIPTYQPNESGWYRPLKDEPKYNLQLETARTKYDLRNSRTYPVAFTDFER